MRGCVSSRQRFQSNCLANAALRGERVASLFRAPALSLSPSLSPSLLLSPAHSRSRAPGSRPGRDRFERSRRPSSARPRPDTASASHSLSLDLSSLSAPVARLIPPPLSLFLSHSLNRLRRVFIHVYTHTFPLPHKYPTLLTHLRSPTICVVSIERAFCVSSRPSPTARTHARRTPPPARLDSAIIDVSYRLLPPPTLAHFSTFPVPFCFPSPCHPAAFAAPPSRASRDYFLLSPSSESSLEYHRLSLTLSL